MFKKILTMMGVVAGSVVLLGGLAAPAYADELVSGEHTQSNSSKNATSILFRFGNGINTTGNTKSKAWKDMVAHDHATGGVTKTGLQNTAAYKNNASIREACHTSGYIWIVGSERVKNPSARRKLGHVWVNINSARSVASNSRSLWRGESRPKSYKGFVADTTALGRPDAINTVVKANTAFVCSKNIAPKVKCEDLPEWSSHLSRTSVTGTTEFSSRNEALAGCILVCPTTVSNLPANARLINANSRVPRGSATANKGSSLNATQRLAAGSHCFERVTTTKEQDSETSYHVTSDKSGSGADDTQTITAEFGWVTSVNEGRSDQVTARSNFANGGVVNQELESAYSPFGQWLINQFNSNNAANKDIFALIAAQDIDEMNKGARYPSVKLSEENKTAFARGGVVDVASMTYSIPISSTKTQPKLNWRWRDVRVTHNASWNGLNASSTTNLTWSAPVTDCRPLAAGSKTTPGAASGSWGACGTVENSTNWGSWKYAYNNVSAWENSGPATFVSSLAATNTPNTTNYWQAMSNHCYADGYNAQKNNGGGTSDISNGDTSKNFSGSVIGPMTTTDNRRWGAGTGITDTAAFYDRECAYFGVRANDDNTVISGSEKRAEVEQTFFRDNKLADFKVDLFVPAYPADSVVKYNGESAVSTTVSRWNGGSPDLKGATIERGKGGTFNMKADGQDLFDFENNEAPAEQKNWDVSTQSGRNVGQVEGQHNIFQVQGSWPSEKGAPQVFTVKWEYEPMVSNRIPTTLGFGIDGVQSYELENVSVPVQGKVVANFAEDKSEAKTQDQMANTGSGVANNLDGLDAFRVAGGLVASNAPATEWSQSPTSFSDYFTALRFVRAAGN